MSVKKLITEPSDSIVLAKRKTIPLEKVTSLISFPVSLSTFLCSSTEASADTSGLGSSPAATMALRISLR